MSELLKGETFTDVSPGKTVTSTRLNNHVDNAKVLVGAITGKTEVTATATDDQVLVADTSDSGASEPKRCQLSNLLPETIRQGVPQYAAGTLSGGVFAVTLSPAATAYTEGMVVRFKADSANAGAVDINVNAIAAKNLFTRAGAELAANDILAGQVVTCVYDGTRFIVQEVLSAGEVTATHLVEANRQSIHQYAAGTLNTGVYAVTLAPAATAYTAGLVVRFKADSTNAGAVDINVNALGAKNLFYPDGKELDANDIAANEVVTAVYDGTQFLWMAPRKKAYVGTAAATLAAGTAGSTFAHGLGATPRYVRAVLICVDAGGEAPWAQNDELEVHSVFDTASGEPRIAVWANATNVVVALRDTGIRAVSASATLTSLTAAKWKVKVYAGL